METILLVFCLMSLMLSSVIVFVELVRDRYRQRITVKSPSRIVKEGRHSVLKKQSVSSSKPDDGGVSVKPQYLEFLKKELSNLGYSTIEQQIKFLNWVLNTQHEQFHELTPQELKKAFAATRRYKVTQENITPPLVAQSA